MPEASVPMRMPSVAQHVRGYDRSERDHVTQRRLSQTLRDWRHFSARDGHELLQALQFHRERASASVQLPFVTSLLRAVPASNDRLKG